jgi:hypothetical protein
MLRPEDENYLASHAISYQLVTDSQGTHVTLTDLPLPVGLEPSVVDVLITLPPGFNDLGPDMFWCYPSVTRTDGQGIPGTESTHDFNGRTWQRWSRHIGACWRPGIDNLATYIAYVKRAVADVGKEAA